MVFHVPSDRTAVLLSLPILALALSACTLAGEPVPAGPIETGPLPGEASRLTPAEPPDVASGAQSFAEHCAKCHGPQGKGDGESAATLAKQGAGLPDLTNPSFGRTNTLQDLFRVITLGNIAKLMPPWQTSLSDAERWNAAAYVASLSSPADTSTLGAQVYSANCAKCHGDHGSENKLNDPAAMAVLSPQDLHDRYTGNGTDGNHLFGTLDDESRWAVTAYARSLSTRAGAPTPTPSSAAATDLTPGIPSATEAATAAVTTTGTVRGTVSNGTPGGASPTGNAIQLKGVTLDANGHVVDFLTRAGTVAADGSFGFDDLPFDRAQSAYAVSVVYNGVEFTNAELIDPSKPAIDLALTVYESTSDPAVLSVATHSLLVQHRQDALVITELMVVSNASDRVFVSADALADWRKGNLAISIPAGAVGLTFESGTLGERFEQVGNTIYDTEQVLPGSQSQSISLSYILPFDGALDIAVENRYATGEFNVLAEEGLDISSAQLQTRGATQVAGQSYTQFSAQNLAAGQPVSFRAAVAAQLTDVLRIVLSGLLVALVVGSGALWLAQRRRPARRGAREAKVHLDNELIRQIAALDDDFEAGKINRIDYETQRAALKAEVADRMREN